MRRCSALKTLAHTARADVVENHIVTQDQQLSLGIGQPLGLKSRQQFVLDKQGNQLAIVRRTRTGGQTLDQRAP